MSETERHSEHFAERQTDINPLALGQHLVTQAEASGFACAGIASVEPSTFRAEFDDWLSQGMQGTMRWMEDHVELRNDSSKLINNGCCALMVCDVYASRSDQPDPPIRKGQGKIARYARGKDYHKVIKKRLITLADELREQFPNEQFRVFVDTAPVLERELAQRAGMGWIGKHTLMIHPRLGSFVFLGGVLTTLKAEAPKEQQTVSDHCGTCSACIDACPTDAITPHRVDARRCISYLTIEHREVIEPELESKMGDWIYGCDICQEVCPHNSPKPEALVGRANPAYQSNRNHFDLLEVLQWDEEDRRAAFTGSAMKRAKLHMMHRNARIVANNQELQLD